MNKIIFIVLAGTILCCLSACRDDNDDQPVPYLTTDLNQEVLTDFSANVAQGIYNDLASKTSFLLQSILSFNSAPDEIALAACKQAWRDARSPWKQSEAFLFGPVATENIDPRIDSWPVNFTDLDSVLRGTITFDESYINSLDDALKGFHPIEYLLFGEDGNKTSTQFNQREKEYIEALAVNLITLTSQLAASWNPQQTGNYAIIFRTAGSGSAVYSTQRAAFEELVNGMAGICDEVANGRMNEPFVSQDPSMEESPFAKNSLADFTNNIKGVQDVYLGKYTVDGRGLEDLVRTHNLSLDGSLKAKINSAIAALNNITVPFGQAIISQPVQVQNAIDAVNALKDVLENDLMDLVAQRVS